MRRMSGQCYAASSKGAPKAFSHGFILELLSILSLTVARGDYSLGCFPHYLLRGDDGVSESVDFAYILISDSDGIAPSQDLVVGWWTVKRWPTGDVRAFFRSEFSSSFRQLRQQALVAFKHSPEIAYAYSVLSCGTWFALLRWRRPGSDDVSMEPAFSWVQDEKALLQQELEAAAQDLLDTAPLYTAAQTRLHEQFSDTEAAKLDSETAKQTFAKRKAALVSGIDRCDRALLHHPAFPDVIYFKERMFTQEVVHSNDGTE